MCVCVRVCVVYGYMYVYQCVLWLGNISIACQYCEIKLYTNDMAGIFTSQLYHTCKILLCIIIFNTLGYLLKFQYLNLFTCISCTI